MRRIDSDGASPVVGFIIAALVFAASFYYVVDTAVQTQSDTSGTEEATLSKTAEALANVLLARGSGWYANDLACVSGIEQSLSADLVGGGRFGLAAEACDGGNSADTALGLLAYSKMKNLYTAKRAEDPANGVVDYDEARASLGLDDRRLDFHLRSWPVLASVRSVLERGYGDPNIRPAYLGDYVEQGGQVIRPKVTHTALVDEIGDYVSVEVTLTNNAADSVESAFMISFSIDLKRGAITWDQNTFVLAPGDSQTVTTKVLKTKDWNWGGKPQKFTYIVQDVVGELPGTHQSGPGFANFVDGATINMANHASNRRNVFVNLDRLSYVLNEGGSFGQGNAFPSAVYQAFDGEGRVDNTFKPQDSNQQYSVRIIRSGGGMDEQYWDLGANSETLNDITPNDYTAGEYTVQMRKGSPTAVVLNDDVFEVLPNAANSCNVDPGDYAPAASVTTEAGYMDRLFANFDLNVISSNFHHASVPYTTVNGVAIGDIYPDVKCALDGVIEDKLTHVVNGQRVGKVGTADSYSAFVVGSNVAHNSLTSDKVKGSIEKWVKAGGTLIVMGSDAQAVQWLQPLFHAALESGSGGIFVPDEEHPVLRTPNDLDYDNFNEDSKWSYNAGADAKFTHVVKDQNLEDDLLGLSNPGAFEKGRVVLTGWRPYALTPDTSETCPPPGEITSEAACQAIFLIHNLVTISFRELYLDYGPPIPVGEPVGQQSRIMSVYHPDLGQTVTLRVQVFVFAGS